MSIRRGYFLKRIVLVPGRTLTSFELREEGVGNGGLRHVCGDTGQFSNLQIIWLFPNVWNS